MGQKGQNTVVRVIPERERRKFLAEVIWEHGGNIIISAYVLGIHRSSMYRYVWRYRLWPVVNAARERRFRKNIDKKRIILIK